MATPSQVKTGLDEIAKAIRNARAVLIAAQSDASGANGSLAALPTTYADTLATIDAYGTTDAFEALAKAELAKLTAEFVALQAGAATIIGADLG